MLSGMSDSDNSQNEAQFGMTGGFQFVAFTLDVACVRRFLCTNRKSHPLSFFFFYSLWGAAMVSTTRINKR
jgi:hypothetical protein